MPESPIRLALPLLLCGLVPAPQGHTQPPTPPATKATQQKLVWPRDTDRVIARVDGRDLTFGDMVQHVKERHDPFFDKLLGTVEGGRCFTHDRIGTDWVRQYADVVALRAEATDRGIDDEKVDKALGDALKAGFEPYLAELNLPAEPSQELVNFHLARFQRYHGLRTEIRGWLEVLVPDEVEEAALRAYFAGNPWVFGGMVTMSHILVRHRDPHTLELLDGDARQTAWSTIADIKARLKDDGSNFEELAARFSEDRRTGAKGGILEHVERFQPGLPAILCRTGWNLPNGGVAGPVESPYGIHLVKRISISKNKMVLYTDGARPMINQLRRRHWQENLLYDQREKRGIKLFY